MHLLLLTGIGVYSFVWIAALYRSLAARPVLIGGETVLLRVGFLWRAEFRRDRIRSVRRFSAADEMRRCRLRPFGRRKAVTRIGVSVDDGEAFGAALGVGGGE